MVNTDIRSLDAGEEALDPVGIGAILGLELSIVRT